MGDVYKLEVKADKDGKFYLKKVVKDDKWVCKVTAKFVGKLVKPKECTIKATLSVDGKALKFEAKTAKPVTIGPFAVNRCDCVIELEGVSDKPNEVHLLEAEGGLA
jgi:hypothetical protein